MDKRIIWFALIVILIAAAIFVFRKGCNNPVAVVTPGQVITPDFFITPGVIKAGDSIHFEDHTAGAASWRWDFSDGADGTSTQQSGYITYYTSGVFTVKLVINDSIMDSTFVEVRAKRDDLKGPSKLPPIVDKYKTAYIGEPVTFTDKTPGAEHTNWQNNATAEIKRDSKTYTTIYARKGSFTITATNEKNTGQGIITVKVIEKPPQDQTNRDKKDPPIILDLPPEKKPPSNEYLKKLFNDIVTGREESTVKSKPVRNIIQDDRMPVIIKGDPNPKTLYSFCQYLNASNVTVVDVQSDWDNGVKRFKTITVTLKDNN